MKRDPALAFRIEDDDSASAALARLEEWFAANGWRAFDFQREVWRAYLAGESGLVHSATGTGKTLSAWLGPLAEWMAEGPSPPPSPKGEGAKAAPR